jgi:predicted cation transporter
LKSTCDPEFLFCMGLSIAAVLLVILLIGPLVAAPLEHNIEIFFLAMGLLASIALGSLSWHGARQAATEPLMISTAVIGAGALFNLGRERLEAGFERMASLIPRWLLTALAVTVIAMASSVITAIVAALIMIEVVRLLHLDESSRVRVTVCGCFAIGLGAALTPIGEPLATLAARAMKLPFHGLIVMLGLYVIPAIPVFALLAGWYAARGAAIRRAALDAQPVIRTDETQMALRVPLWMAPYLSVILQGAQVYVFVAGLVLISEAYAPFARRYLELLSDTAIFWGNMVSAALDNATLVAIEVHDIEPHRAREAIVALLVSGGMLIPGNVPNIICAGALGIGSRAWARTGVPLGLIAMALYFFVLRWWG